MVSKGSFQPESVYDSVEVEGSVSSKRCEIYLEQRLQVEGTSSLRQEDSHALEEGATLHSWRSSGPNWKKS